jgi:hypothetical protein
MRHLLKGKVPLVDLKGKGPLVDRSAKEAQTQVLLEGSSSQLSGSEVL